MTNNSDTQRPSSNPQTIKKSTRGNETRLTSKGPFRRTFLITFISLVVACLVCGLLVYVWMNHQTKEEMNALLAELNSLKQQQSNLKNEFMEKTTSLSTSQEKSHQQLNALNKNLHTLLQQQQYQASDWLLLKTRYCLELAQINAHWGTDPETTIALLQQADTLLADIQDQHFYLVRQAISKEIAAIQTSPKLDIAGMLSQLDAAQDVVATLLLKPTVTPKKDNALQKNPSKPSTWHTKLKESVGLLEKLVVVRRHDEAILPLPSPAYEAMLRESIRLNIEEAKWAVLQNNESIYQFSLAQAIKNINRAFEPNTIASNALIKQITHLQQLHLVQQKTILDQSLPLLNQLINAKDNLSPTSSIRGHTS